MQILLEIGLFITRRSFLSPWHGPIAGARKGIGRGKEVESGATCLVRVVVCETIQHSLVRVIANY